MMGIKLSVYVKDDYVTINTEDGFEVCHWIKEEWEEDSSIVPSIVNAICMAYAAPEKLLELCKEHIEAQKMRIT